MSMSSPSGISVVIPAFNAARDIDACLSALLSGSLVPDEIIVVDDGSRDETAELAREKGVKVVCLDACMGAANARNVGAREACGAILLFLDADVVVHPDTVRQVRERFLSDPVLDAVMGAYDDKPSSLELLSQYRNLMHCYTHRIGVGEACTFWTGCGAVRAEAFRKVGGFDIRYRAMEDVDLGQRLFSAGYRIDLDASIEVQHRKRWTFLRMVKADIFDRGIPWTLIILRSGSGMPNRLNLQWVQRVSVLGVAILVALAMHSTVKNGGGFLTPLLGSALLVLSGYWVTELCFRRSRVVIVGLLTSLSFFAALCVSHYKYGALVLVLSAYVVLFGRELWLKRNRRAYITTGMLYGGFLAFSLVYMIILLPNRYEVYAFWSLSIALIAVNLHFYWFLSRRLGKLCGAATVPFHMFFYLYSGLSFAMGVYQYLTERRARSAAHRKSSIKV